MNEIKRRTIILDYEGEEFYRLLDLTGGIIHGYLISTNGNILSNKRSKNGTYSLRHITSIKNKRSHIKLSKGYGHVERYASELVAANFLTIPKKNYRVCYIINGKKYIRKYRHLDDWYIIFKDGDVTNHKLSNITYADYKEYICHCSRMKQKPIIKNIDKELMTKMYKENPEVSRSRISKTFGLHESTFSRIYRMYK